MTLPSRILFTLTSPKAKMPTYATPGAAGADLYSIERVELPAGGRQLVMTGVKLEIPDGYEAQVRPRSGLAVKRGVTVLNAPGTIDSDFRGEVGVVLVNHGTHACTVREGDRIAQLVFARVERMHFVPADELGTTDRGASGFGSTGS